MTKGLINAGPEEDPAEDPDASDDPQGMASGDEESTQLQDPVLQAAENKLEAGLTPQNRQNYMKIVISGMRIALQGGDQGILAKLHDSQDPINDCAVGAVHLVVLMRKQARGTMPLQAMVPAAMTLMLKALDFADKGGLIQVDEQVLVKATHIFTNTLFKAFQISPNMLQNAAQNVHGMTQDPVRMAAIQRAAGMKPNVNQEPVA